MTTGRLRWFATLVLAGTRFLAAQGTAPTTQFDYWNWFAVKAPAPAQGIVVDTSSDQTWYLATASGLYVTRDGGGTWNQALTGPVAKHAIAIDPVNPGVIYVGAGSSIYVSLDQGATWNKGASFSQPIASVFVSPTDESVFVGPQMTTGFAGIYRSRDQGATWTPVPYGAAFAAINTTLQIAEDGSGWLWAATQASPLTPGKNMLLYSSDRGATWVDASSAITAPPTNVVWDAASGGLYVSGSFGLVATGNQGVHWAIYLRAPVLAVALLPVPVSVGVGPGILAGLDTGGGGGASFEFTLPPYALVDIHYSPLGVGTAIGLQGVAIQSLALNHSGTRFLAIGGDGGIYGGTVFQPTLNPAILDVVPGGSLVIGCETCPIGIYTGITIGGKPGTLVQDSPPIPYTVQSVRWDVPTSMAFGTYPAQILTTGQPVPFTVVVGNAPPKAPTITTMESVRFGVKPQYGLGEVVSIFGTSLTGAVGTSSAANYSSGLPLATQLAQSEVLVEGTPAPLYYAYTGSDGSSQINFQIPSSLSPGPHKLQVSRLLASGAVDATTADFPFTVAAVSPTYIVDSSGNAYVQDVTQDPAGGVFANSNTTPARSTDVAVIYATGLGATSPALDAGSVPPPGTLAKVLAPVSISLWDGLLTQWKANLLGAVASPQFPGLYQIAFQFPGGVTPIGSAVKLIVAVGSDSQTFSINFKP